MTGSNQQTTTKEKEVVTGKEVVKRKRPKYYLKADVELKEKLQTVLADEDKSYDDVLKYVENEIKEAVRVVGFNYTVNCFREDGAYALSRAVEDIHGFTTQEDRKSMSGTNPPIMIDIRFADGSRKKVPFGRINLPSIGKDSFIEMSYDSNLRQMFLKGQCERRFVNIMNEIVERTKTLVETDSIYKGQAIKIVDEVASPQFIDLTGIDRHSLFLTPDAQFSTMAIEARIEKSEACLLKGIDLRFGVLLEGNFGTGKTLYAFKLARKAILNGWSFVYCQRPEKALYVMETANMLCKNGKGVVIFIEDIDRILNERSDLTNQISVMMDGGETKSNNVITILTTNYIERIDPTFMRGKRIGTIVSLTYPDVATAKQMIESYLMDENRKSILSDDCTPAAIEIEKEQIVPAFIAEILDRVKSHLIYSGKKTVSCEDILNSIKSYKRQMEIATNKRPEASPSEKLVSSIRDVFFPETLATKEDISDIANLLRG